MSSHVKELLEQLKRQALKDECVQARRALPSFILTLPAPSGEPEKPGNGQPVPNWLLSLCNQPFAYSPAWNFDELCQNLLIHYYQKPPAQVLKKLLFDHGDDIHFRRFHDQDHIIRTMLLADAAQTLFEGYPPFDALLDQHPDFGELYILAELFHDIYAEVEGLDAGKSEEERIAAEAFLDIFTRNKRYNHETVAIVASALLNKNTRDMEEVSPPYTPDSQVSEQERLLRMLIRLPDTLDVVRVRTLAKEFPAPLENSGNPQLFDSSRIDLPEDLRQTPEFMRKLYSLLKAARDLASVSGGAPFADENPAGRYHERYQLRGFDNNLRRRKVQLAINPIQSLREILSDNARRSIARRAGLPTCTATHKKNDTSQPDCIGWKAGQKRKVKIHNEHDLREVRLPQNINTLELFLCSQIAEDPCWDLLLRPEIAREVTQEIEHLEQNSLPVKKRS